MKYLVLLFIGISTFANIPKSEITKASAISNDQKDAFRVLDQKCNVCHAKQNPSKVFTLENMNDYARKVNRQVFVWKRMPKGDEVSLTQAEKITLKNWLNKQLKN